MKISKAVIKFFWSVVILGFAINIFTNPVSAYFGADFLRIVIVGVLLLFLAFLSWHRYSTITREELLSQYQLFKEIRELEPEDLNFQRIEPGEPVKPSFRPYYKTYIPRKAIPYERSYSQVTSVDSSQIYTEEQLAEYLTNSSEGLLLIGGPTEGKSRTLFEIIRKLSDFVVIKIEPGKKLTDAALELLKGKKVLWLVDDLHTLAEPIGSSFTFDTMLTRIKNVAKPSTLTFAGTSLNSGELGKFDFATTPIRRFYGLFKRRLVLKRADDEDIRKLKDAINDKDTRKLPTLGSICMREHFEEMRTRFRRMGRLEKNCVLSLILLNEVYIYEMTQPRILALLSEIFTRVNPINSDMLPPAIARLQEDGFIVSIAVSGAIIPEAAYITGEEAAYYYSEGTKPERRKPEDDKVRLAECLSKNKDADGMFRLAVSYYDADQIEIALNLLEQIIAQFEKSPEPQRNIAAQALLTKGFALGKFGEPKQAIACYDLVEARYKDATESIMREMVARALVNKGFALEQLGQSKQAIACYDLAEARYKDERESALREQVAGALVNKGFALGKLGEPKQAIGCYDLVDERYKDAPEPALRVWIARALFNKADVLGRLGESKQAIACYDLAEARYKDAPEPALRERVAKVLFNKGIVLMQLGESEQAIVCFNLVEARYKDAPESIMREWVGKALFNKGNVLGKRGDLKQAIDCYDLVDARYKDATEPIMRELVARALFNKGFVLGEFVDPKQAIACFDIVEARYKDASEPVLQDIVETALVYRAQLNGEQ